jgi:ethanolamine utilization protein EutQ
MAKSISAQALREMACGKTHLDIPVEWVLTPGAIDWARENGMTLNWGEIQKYEQFRKTPEVASSRVEPNVELDTNDFEGIKKMIRATIATLTQPAPGQHMAQHIKAADIPDTPLETGKPGDKITLQDAISAKNSNLCAGIMSFDHCTLPWYCGYDEVAYVLEGEYHLQVGAEKFVGRPGDVLYLPANSEVVFGSPAAYSKVFYVTHPANWADHSKK